MKGLILFLVFFLLIGGSLFGGAGRLDLPFFWAYLGVLLAAIFSSRLVMDRSLVRERVSPGEGGVDRKMRLYIMPFFLGHLLVAGLDAGRFSWSARMPGFLRIVGLVGFVLSFGVTLWSIKVNRFFSPVVRIQTERGHHLVTDGPYRWIRHPGYSASLASLVCSGLLLGSWWSYVPLLGAAFLLLRRVVIEDRFLRENLSGYAEYAARVRFRLIPKVW